LDAGGAAGQGCPARFPANDRPVLTGLDPTVTPDAGEGRLLGTTTVRRGKASTYLVDPYRTALLQ
jgi:hypothetical protein